jgi:hypothetical protein
VLAGRGFAILGDGVLTDQFCDELEIARGSSPTDLIYLLEASGRDPFFGLLTTEDGRIAAAAFFESANNYVIRIVKQLAPPQQKFCKVEIDGQPSAVLVALLGLCENELPTDMENLILLAIFQEKLGLAGAWCDGPGGRVLNWRGRIAGLAIIAEPIPIKPEVALTVAAVFGLEDAGLGVSSAPTPITHSAAQIVIGAPTRYFSEVQGRLVFEASSVTHPKWRFLSLYRILENAYLRNIKKALLDDFDRDATRSVDEAKKKLSSEINQLIDLMKSQQLDAQFIAFNDEFDRQLAAQNRYITAIDKNAETDGNYGNRDVAIKAVVRFYKIRCSIAHAGSSSVIYEQLYDANSGTIALLSAVEAIILKSLNITAT